MDLRTDSKFSFSGGFRKKYCVLSDYNLLIFENKESQSSPIAHPQIFIHRRFIKVCNADIHAAKSSQSSKAWSAQTISEPFVFVVELENKQQLILRASSDEERRQWVDKINISYNFKQSLLESTPTPSSRDQSLVHTSTAPVYSPLLLPTVQSLLEARNSHVNFLGDVKQKLASLRHSIESDEMNEMAEESQASNVSSFFLLHTTRFDRNNPFKSGIKREHNE